MKFTVLINQAGIVDACLVDKTDWSDWAILEYVAEWQVHGSAYMVNGHVWLDYRHLMDEIPMLGIKTCGGISKRVSKLRDLGLLTSFLIEGSRLFVKVTDFYCSIKMFRGDPTKKAVDSLGDNHEPFPVGNAPFPVGNAPFPVGNAPFPVGNAPFPVGNLSNNQVINNQVINNQEQNTLNAGAREELPEVPINATQWAAFFVNVHGFAIHEAQTAKSIPMFADWVNRGIAVADVEMAVVAGNAWLKGQGHTGPPHNVCLYGGFLETVLANKRKPHAISKQPKPARPQVDPGFAEKYPHLC